MTDEERRRLGGAAPAVQQPAQPVYQQTQAQQPVPQAGVLGGADTDAQVAQAYQNVTGTPYKYNLDADATYQMYRDRYLQNAKRSMQDTMGQAAALTGGYGNTYSQWVGQQAYDETMRGLTDLIPQFEERAWNRRQQTYSQLSSSILQTGYKPTAEELQAAGMTAAQAESLFQAFIASNPAAAWMQGLMTEDQYYKLTGRTPPGAPGKSGSGGGGGGGGRGSGSKKTTGDDNDYMKDDRVVTGPEGNQITINAYGEMRTGTNPTRGEVDRAAKAAYAAGDITYEQYRTIRSSVR